jgi:hypothetical protein
LNENIAKKQEKVFCSTDFLSRGNYFWVIQYLKAKLTFVTNAPKKFISERNVYLGLFPYFS